MSSSRFPGKVLAPFRGRPLIRNVLDRIEAAQPAIPVVVVTSDQEPDDPLVAYLHSQQVSTFRGPLEDVFERFRRCWLEFPCDWILRISADSPLLEPEAIHSVLAAGEGTDLDLVTTVAVRTFPNGQNAELIRAATFMALDPAKLSSYDCEHVTPYYYANSDRFRILNVESSKPRPPGLSFVVDTVEDLHRLEQSSRGTSP